MTLVVALSCRDGIVMASDGQATIGSSGGPVRVETEKIFKINNSTLFAASGSVGNIQKSLEVVKSIKDLENDWNRSIMETVRLQLFNMYRSDLDRHVAFYKTLNPNQVPQPPTADVILAKVQEGGSNIIWHIAPDCNDELLQDLTYGCTGNGNVFAHTLLKGFDIRNMNIEEGKLIAFNVIKLGIEIGAYGLGEPIDIRTICKNENGCIEVDRLSEEEKMALRDVWGTWREVQRELFKNIVEKHLNSSNNK